MTPPSDIPKPFESYSGDGNYVFVSYSHEDKVFVYEAMSWLRQKGINIWYDEGIEPASEWLEEIAFAIKKSVMFVVFVSPRSVESRFVKSEVGYALSENKDILTIYLEDTTLPAGLSLCLQQFQSVFLTEKNWRDKTKDTLLAKLALDEETTVEVKEGAILGECRMLRRIGTGGYGEVWVARSEKGSKLVAIKLVRADDEEASGREMDALSRFREVVAEGGVSGMTEILQMGRTKSHFWYIMPLADGVEDNSPETPSWKPLTMARFLNQRKESEPKRWFESGEIIDLFLPLILAIEALSAKGLSHRDVKPDNVLFFDGVPHLGDIGLLAEDREEVTVRGTPGFAPPSWFLETRGNPDQWGLAGLLFTMLTGNSPDVMGRVHYEWPPGGKDSLSESEQKKWEALRRIVYRATEENPVERYRDFRTFREKVEAVRDGPLDDAAPPPRQTWRRRTLVLGVVAAVVALVTLIDWGGSNEQKEKPPPRPPPSPGQVKLLAKGSPGFELRLNGTVVELSSGEPALASEFFTLKPDDVLTVRNETEQDGLHFACLVLNHEGKPLFGTNDEWRAFTPRDTENWWDLPDGLVSEGLVQKAGPDAKFGTSLEKETPGVFPIRSTLRQLPTVSFLYHVVSLGDLIPKE